MCSRLKINWNSLFYKTCSGFCKTSYHLLISLPPTDLPNTLILERIKLTARVECGASIHAIFQQTVQWIRIFFLAYNLLNPKGNHPSKFQLAGVRRFGGVREHPNRHTDRLTHWQTEALIERWLLTDIISMSLNLISIDYISLYKSNRISISESACLYACYLTPPKRANPVSWNFRDDFPLDEEGFRLKNIWLRWTVSRKMKKK